MRALSRVWWVVALLALFGCGGRRVETPLVKPPEKPPSPSLEFGGSVIRIADPKGNWTFEARSAKVNAKTTEGPFSLSPADGVYREKGRAPVNMSAAAGDIDKQAGRVALKGHVRITSDDWLLEADRVDYDLDSGKVVSPGRTKLTFQPSAKQLRRGGGAKR